MTDIRDTEAEPHFSQPTRQIISMLVVLVLVGVITYISFGTIELIFQANPYLNGLILFVFVLGVLSCFGQVVQLMFSVRWIEDFSRGLIGDKVPTLLAPLATLLRGRGQSRMQLSSSSSKSIQESVASRIDEDREITKYLGSTLIFLGLLGTFYGLATTVPALVETIRSLNPTDGESGVAIFGRLQAGLEKQLGGMGTAFSSSLLGLVGSLIVGLLELFAGHGQNRFYRELEEWLSSITRLGFASGEESGGTDTGAIAGAFEHLAEQLENLHGVLAQSEANRDQLQGQLGLLATGIDRLSRRMEKDDPREALIRVADGQERLIDKLRDSGVDGIDAESRMRLRSIDVQLLRILEEISAGRQETLNDLRAEIANLGRAVRSGRPGRPDAPGE